MCVYVCQFRSSSVPSSSPPPLDHQPICSNIKRSYTGTFNELVLWSSIPTMGKRSKRKKREQQHTYSYTNNNWLRFLIHAFNLPSWSSCLFLLVFYFDELQHMTDWPINRYTGINALETLDTFKLFDFNKSIYVYSRTKERCRVLAVFLYVFFHIGLFRISFCSSCFFFVLFQCK